MSDNTFADWTSEPVRLVLAEIKERLDLDQWPAFASFLRYLRDEGLDPEMYGELLNSQPDLIDVIWSGYWHAWEHR